MFKPIFKPAVLGVNYVRKTWTEPKRQVARWLRQELVNYGPVYVKVGQFIAARKDFFPEHLTQELKNLHDNVEPLEYDDIMKVIKDESLNCGLKNIPRLKKFITSKKDFIDFTILKEWREQVRPSSS